MARFAIYALLLASACAVAASAEEFEVDAMGGGMGHEDEGGDEDERESDDDADEPSAPSAPAPSSPSSPPSLSFSTSAPTFGEEWLARENVARVGYYKKKAAALYKQALGETTGDPFLLAWEALNAVVAVMELRPRDAESWVFAGKMALKMVALEDVGVQVLTLTSAFSLFCVLATY